jgi:hypothetical protein
LPASVASEVEIGRAAVEELRTRREGLPGWTASSHDRQPGITRRLSANIREIHMENLRGPDRGESIHSEGSTGFEGPEGPVQFGPTLKRPERLEEGDLVVAVSRAVLRELEGGSIREQLQKAWVTTGVQPVDPFTPEVNMTGVPSR